jgi:3-oxoacyl-[acyl-carrier-protein] synthase II
VNSQSPAMVATGWSLHLPGVAVEASTNAALGRPVGAWARRESVPPEQAAAVLGRKGLLYKEPATRMALCAVHRALGLPAGRRPAWSLSPDTAVIAASNLGNVQTVATVARTVVAEGGKAVSVLDAPNVSSNVIASTIALWFGFGGPNLMVCSGADAGLDGLALAELLLRAGRAKRAVVIGVEASDDVARTLYAAGPHEAPLTAGAACVILELRNPDAAPAPGQVVVEAIRDGGHWAVTPQTVIGPEGFDVLRRWGDFYGAHGVIALALAAHLVADEHHHTVGVRASTVCARTLSVHSATAPEGSA